MKSTDVFGRSRDRIAAYCKPCRAIMGREATAAKRGIITPEDIARFWSRVKKQAEPGPLETPCWLWDGAPRNADGYGQVHWAGKNTSPHLVALQLVGRVAPPETPYADHMCRVRMCCNPDHLRFVTPRVNCLENNDSPWAKNAAKTHCIRGHEFTPENTYITPSKPGQRNCKACWTARALEKQAANGNDQEAA